MDAIARFKSFLGAPSPEARGYMPLERERPPSQGITRTLVKAVVRLHVLCLFYGLGTSVWGYPALFFPHTPLPYLCPNHRAGKH